jgi:hypothetical protein
MTESLSVKSGDTLLFTEGEYSDYKVLGSFTAVRGFSFDEVREAYLLEVPEEREPYMLNFTSIIEWMKSHDYIQQIETKEIHLGAYSCWAPR